jgi:PilZ domain
MHSLETHDRNSREDPSVGDLRSGRRHQCTVTSVAVHSTNDTESFAALILDVSKSGLRLRAERALSPGHQVTVSFADAKKNTVIHAEARFCHSGQDGTYEIGLEITDYITTA